MFLRWFEAFKLNRFRKRTDSIVNAMRSCEKEPEIDVPFEEMLISEGKRMQEQTAYLLEINAFIYRDPSEITYSQLRKVQRLVEENYRKYGAQ